MTTPSLQALVSAFSANRGIAVSLNAKLEAAERAHFALVRAIHYGAFVIQAKLAVRQGPDSRRGGHPDPIGSRTLVSAR